MKQLTIISGPQGSGKTRLALAMVADKKAVLLPGVEYRYLKEAMDIDPEVIILDEATLPKIEIISYYLQQKVIIYRPIYSRNEVKKPFPPVIACTQTDLNLEHIQEIDMEFIKLKQ